MYFNPGRVGIFWWQFSPQCDGKLGSADLQFHALFGVSDSLFSALNGSSGRIYLTILNLKDTHRSFIESFFRFRRVGKFRRASVFKYHLRYLSPWLGGEPLPGRRRSGICSEFGTCSLIDGPRIILDKHNIQERGRKGSFAACLLYQPSNSQSLYNNLFQKIINPRRIKAFQPL